MRSMVALLQPDGPSSDKFAVLELLIKLAKD